MSEHKNKKSVIKLNWENKKYWSIFLAFYILVIIKLIVFKYPINYLIQIAKSWSFDSIRNGIASANFIPFKTIKMYIRYYKELNSFENIFGNILIFVPFGFCILNVFRKMKNYVWLLLFSGIFILDIELFQLVTRFGEFDIDDIILNILGVMIGYELNQIFRYLSYKYKKRKDAL